MITKRDLTIIIHYCITQLADTNNAPDFKNLIASDEYDFRFSCGVTQPTARTQFSDKQKFVNAMCLHYSILVSLAELEQLRHGMAVQKFDSLMASFPQLLQKAFQPSQRTITSEYIQDIFVAVLSPVGSNKRPVEEAIMMRWICYLQYLEGEVDFTCTQELHNNILLLFHQARAITAPPRYEM